MSDIKILTYASKILFHLWHGIATGIKDKQSLKIQKTEI